MLCKKFIENLSFYQNLNRAKLRLFKYSKTASAKLSESAFLDQNIILKTSVINVEFDLI